MIKINDKLRPVGFILTIIFLFFVNRAQAQEDKGTWIWFDFKFSDAEANKLGDDAVDHLSKGLALIIVSFANGHKNKDQFDLDQIKVVQGELSQSINDFNGLTKYISQNKIDANLIVKMDRENKTNYYSSFSNLIEDIKKNHYNEPVDGEILIVLLVNIIRQTSTDVNTLTSKSTKPADVEIAAIDLIRQKILLEKLGGMMGIITTAMQ
jgi:hypothetical protein